jgi:hypothetical protein
MVLYPALAMAQAAPNPNPSVAWLTVTQDGDVVSWALTKRSAERSARTRSEPCHIARLDPKDY